MSFSIYVEEAVEEQPRRPAARPAVPLPAQDLPVIGGGEDKKLVRSVVELGADIGDVVAVVIQGDGPFGVFVGTLAAIETGLIRLVLTAAVGPIPAGTVLTILIDQIAAFGRVPVAVAATV